MTNKPMGGINHDSQSRLNDYNLEKGSALTPGPG